MAKTQLTLLHTELEEAAIETKATAELMLRSMGEVHRLLQSANRRLKALEASSQRVA